MQIAEILLDSAETYAERLALVTETGCATYRQIHRMAMGNIEELKASGIGNGTPVLIPGDSSVDFLAGFFALQYVGAIPAIMNPGCTQAEILHMAGSVGAGHIFSDRDKVTEWRSFLPELAILPISLEQKKIPGFEPYIGQEEDIGVIRFTSGTTGLPKAVAYSHRNMTWGVPLCGFAKNNCHEAYLCPISLSIRFGRYFRIMGDGATVFAFDSFSPHKVAAWASHRHLKRIWASPVMLKRLLDEVEDCGVFRQVGGFSSVGSVLSPSLQTTFQEKFGVGIYQYYGQKECTGLTEMPDDELPRPGSVGKALPGTQIRIYHPDNSGHGEIQYQSVRSAPAYMEQGHPVPRIALADGWHATGDIGWMDPEGYLYVRGRLSRFINVGGLKASPGEIEDVLYQYPGILAAKVTKKANFLVGEVPVAYVVMPGAGSAEKAAIKSFCQERLSKHKVPRRIILVDEIPVNAAGKME